MIFLWVMSWFPSWGSRRPTECCGRPEPGDGIQRTLRRVYYATRAPARDVDNLPLCPMRPPLRLRSALSLPRPLYEGGGIFALTRIQPSVLHQPSPLLT